jgi:glycine oxidase
MKIVIVGAGVAGLAIGWRLRQQGAEVILLDRGLPGRGASWAAAGMIAPAGEMVGAPAAERDLAGRATELWPAFAAELEQACGLDIGYRREGALLVASDPKALEARAVADPALMPLTPEQVRARVPLLTGVIAGALWAPHEARVDNRALTRALAVAFERAGGRLVTQEAVVAIAGRAAVTPFARHAGDAVLVTAGAWSQALNPQLKLVPVKGQMIALQPPGDHGIDGPVVWGEDIYLVPRGGLVLAGATVEQAGFDTSLDPAAAQSLWARAARLMPALKQARLADHWAGLRPRTPDGLPLLGRVQPGVYVAGGQYRNGILFAPAIADMMAAAMRNDGPIPDAFDPLRFA